jgi:hypothetical protein
MAAVDRPNLAICSRNSTSLAAKEFPDLQPCPQTRIFRLDVAVNNAFGVRGIECIGNLDSYFQNALRFHWAIAYQVLQSRAVEKLHRDKRMP